VDQLVAGLTELFDLDSDIEAVQSTPSRPPPRAVEAGAEGGAAEPPSAEHERRATGTNGK